MVFTRTPPAPSGRGTDPARPIAQGKRLPVIGFRLSGTEEESVRRHRLLAGAIAHLQAVTGCGKKPSPLAGRRNKAHGDGSAEPWDQETRATSFCAFPSPQRGRRNRRGAPRRTSSVPPPPSGAGEKGWGLPPQTHGSQGIAVGFIPPPHTGLGHPPDCGGCLQMCYCTPSGRLADPDIRQATAAQ